MLNNRTYDILKFLALIALPGFATFYFSIGSLWDFPNTSEVVRTIVATETFLGFLLGLSTNRYNNSDDKYDGAFEMMEDDEGLKVATLNFEKHPEALGQKKEVLLKVELPKRQ